MAMADIMKRARDAMANIVKRARDHAELLQKMEEISEQPGNDRIVNSPTQKLLRALADEIERMQTALTKINDIRNNVVGSQNMGWSSTIYPLVAALEEAGIEGAGYEQAKDQIVTWNTEIERMQAVINSVHGWVVAARPATKGAHRCLWEIKKLTRPPPIETNHG